VLEEASIAIKNGKEFELTYFKEDKNKKFKEIVNKVIDKINDLPLDYLSDKKLKADLLYSKGKLIDFYSTYDKRAEDALSRSVRNS
jgi:hypothetical protein